MNLKKINFYIVNKKKLSLFYKIKKNYNINIIKLIKIFL